jgi:hypothetical protein
MFSGEVDKQDVMRENEKKNKRQEQSVKWKGRSVEGPNVQEPLHSILTEYGRQLYVTESVQEMLLELAYLYNVQTMVHFIFMYLRYN